MPSTKSPEQKYYIQIGTTVSDAEGVEIVKRFKRFAVDDPNYLKALKRLMDLANVA